MAIKRTFYSPKVRFRATKDLNRILMTSARYSTSHNIKMKRKATDKADSASKRVKEADYCDTPVVKDEHDDIVWPAPQAQIDAARGFIREWSA